LAHSAILFCVCAYANERRNLKQQQQQQQQHLKHL